jgi:hypothetical protein
MRFNEEETERMERDPLICLDTAIGERPVASTVRMACGHERRTAFVGNQAR